MPSTLPRRTSALRLLTVILGFTLAACAGREPAARAPWDDALVSELLARLRDDQAIRDSLIQGLQATGAPDTAVLRRMAAIDSANTAWMREAVARHGWPATSAVGAEAAEAAFLLVQHTAEDTAFQAAMLTELEAAFARGEAKGQSVALLTDRLAVKRGRPQVYGTQADIVDGQIVLAPLADSAGVDARRAAVGLPPLAVYLRVMDSVYLGRTPQ